MRRMVLVAWLVLLACVSAVDGANPAAPSDVTATAGASSASLTWTAPELVTQGVVTGYEVTAEDLSTGAASAPEQTGSTGTSYTVTGLAPGDVYTFTVAARTTNGTGPPSPASNQIVPTLVAVADLQSASGASPAASTSTPGGGTLSADGFGEGTLSVGAYPGAPEAALPSAGSYLDVSESGLRQVSIRFCGATVGDQLEWWDTELSPPAWAPVSPHAVAAGGCVSFPAAASSSPAISQFYGTIFATAGAGRSGTQPPAAPSLRLVSGSATVRRRGAAGAPVADVVVACSTAAACRGTARLNGIAQRRPLLGSDRFDVGAGRHATVSIQLNRAGQRLLAAARHHHLTVRITLAVAGARAARAKLVLTGPSS
jgi:Fibronectin type III domain